MMNTDPTTAELSRHTQEAAAGLIKAELETLRHEFRTEIGDLRQAGVAYGVAALAGVIGAQTLVNSAAAARPKRGVAVATLLFFVTAAALLVADASRREAKERVARRTRTFAP